MLTQRKQNRMQHNHRIKLIFVECQYCLCRIGDGKHSFFSNGFVFLLDANGESNYAQRNVTSGSKQNKIEIPTIPLDLLRLLDANVLNAM